MKLSLIALALALFGTSNAIQISEEIHQQKGAKSAKS